MVSHDRALLDALCTSIWELADGRLRIFPGNYTAWVRQREREREFAQFEYAQYRNEQARLKAEIQNIREQASGMTRAPGRMGNNEARLYKGSISARQKQVQRRGSTMQSRLAHLEKKERPADLPQIRMALGTAHPITAKVAARVEGLTVRCGERTVLENASFALPTGKCTVMLGKNGAGKSTAVSHLMHGGACARFSGGVKAGYFSQNHDVLDESRTVLENVRETSNLPEHMVRTILANLMIAGDAVFKPAGILSGGERAKAIFAKLLASECNLLVLDEPTNHIGLYAMQALEQLLACWQGTLLIVTHDRRLAECAADRLLFVEDKSIRAFEGSWAQWQQMQNCPQASDSGELERLKDQMQRAAQTGDS
jgi:macrolide transport system ATP-binding/permease protein